MYKTNTEKLTTHYAALVQKRSDIETECNKEAVQIAAERGYNGELTAKLTKFLYVEKYKNERLDEEIAYLSGYIDNVEISEGTESGEITN